MYSPFSPLFPLFGEAWEDCASAKWYFSPDHLSSPWCLHLLHKSSEILYSEWQFIFVKLNRLKVWLMFLGGMVIIQSQTDTRSHIFGESIFVASGFFLWSQEGVWIKTWLYLQISVCPDIGLFFFFFFIRSRESCSVSFSLCKAKVSDPCSSETLCWIPYKLHVVHTKYLPVV